MSSKRYPEEFKIEERKASKTGDNVTLRAY